jgi:uncharacterized protein
MTGETQIDYEALAQEAMRGIVRSALRRVAALGYLPGEHHFYIAFDTRAPGVVISKRLKQKYPEEMTIVLQHQFQNLIVTDDRFEVTLSFGNVPERLAIPLRAVRVFFDPSVPYGLQFDGSDLVKDAAGGIVPPGEPDADQLEPATLTKLNGMRKPRTARDAGDNAPVAPIDTADPADASVQRRSQQSARPKLVRPQPDQPANDAKVVQLDKFRKR